MFIQHIDTVLFCSRSGTPVVTVVVELENSWWNWQSQCHPPQRLMH